MNGPLSPAADAQPARKRVTLVEPPAAAMPAAKKQKLDAADDPVADDNDDDDDRPEDDVKLENFRKEAIHREMLAYKRQYERAQSEVDKLRAQRQACELRLSKVEIGWTTLVQEAEMILPSTSAAAANGHARAASPPLTDAHLDDEELEEALSQRSTATKQLLQRLQDLHPSGDAAQSSKVEELEAKCRELLEQSLKSREALRIVRLSHEQTVTQLDNTLASLARAEKRFDRYQSATVAAIEGRVAPAAAHAALALGAAGSLVGSASPMPNGGGKGKDAEGGASGGDQAGGAVAGAMSGELEELRDLVVRRAQDLEELRNDRVRLKTEIDALKAKLVDLPDDIVAETATFRMLQTHVQYLSGEYETKRQECDRATTEADGLREGMETFREAVFVRLVPLFPSRAHHDLTFLAFALQNDAREQVNDLQSRLSSRETDLSRLRAARDELRAEASELKAKEGDRAKALDELRVLAESRAARLEAYRSEVQRLRMDRAAKDGDLEGVEMRASGEKDEEELIKDLQARLKTAEDLLLALRDQLHSYASGAPDGDRLVQSETEARTELAQAQERLAKLEALLGPGGDPQVSALAERLKDREQELKVAEAQVKSQEAASNMLYGEIDRLSAAWSALDEQNASKVFNLVNLEEKIQRLSAEVCPLTSFFPLGIPTLTVAGPDKAKADNRYFATMRQKDALVSENAVLTKLAEKQQQKVESSTEQQHSLGQQLVRHLLSVSSPALSAPLEVKSEDVAREADGVVRLLQAAAEKEITLHQKNIRAYQDNIGGLRRDNTELTLRSEQNAKRIAELNNLLAERISQAESEIAARKRAEEQLAKVERQLQQSQAKVASASAAASSSSDSAEIRELKKYNADLSKMLKCSTCNIRFKSVILTRCGHTFCKECVDARLANRQRKCPNCGGMFGKDDVGPPFYAPRERDLVVSDLLLLLDDDLPPGVELALGDRRALEHLADDVAARGEDGLEFGADARRERVVHVDVVRRDEAGLLAQALHAVDDLARGALLLELGAAQDVEEDDDVVVRVGLVVGPALDARGELDVARRGEVPGGELDAVDRDLARREILLDVVGRDVRERLLDAREVLAELAPEDGVVGVGAELDAAAALVRGEHDRADVEFLLDVREERLDVVEVLLRGVEDDKFGKRGLRGIPG
ncbi:SPOSA6832_03051 [Sporobolomyces salmonicolor]|uniref:E3 ubiquitin protein ligase n=1 Tax=Sporidiobolus salmonicolor TaxID=5005 RepID=A0A0D6EP21_SPOSA|nr:SPOSA6832_03051 [Sporobolomyces salmonicolor]